MYWLLQILNILLSANFEFANIIQNWREGSGMRAKKLCLWLPLKRHLKGSLATSSV